MLTTQSFPQFNTRTFSRSRYIEGVHVMSLWHIEYFGLRALEKGQMQEGHPDLPLYSWKQEIEFLYEKCPPWPRRKAAFIHRQGHVELATFIVKDEKWTTFIFKYRKLRPKEFYTRRPCYNNMYLLPLHIVALLFHSIFSLFNPLQNCIGFIIFLSLHFLMRAPESGK